MKRIYKNGSFVIFMFLIYFESCQSKGNWDTPLLGKINTNKKSNNGFLSNNGINVFKNEFENIKNKTKSTFETITNETKNNLDEIESSPEPSLNQLQTKRETPVNSNNTKSKPSLLSDGRDRTAEGVPSAKSKPSTQNINNSSENKILNISNEIKNEIEQEIDKNAKYDKITPLPGFGTIENDEINFVEKPPGGGGKSPGDGKTTNDTKLDVVHNDTINNLISEIMKKSNLSEYLKFNIESYRTIFKGINNSLNNLVKVQLATLKVLVQQQKFQTTRHDRVGPPHHPPHPNGFIAPPHQPNHHTVYDAVLKRDPNIEESDFDKLSREIEQTNRDVMKVEK